MIDPKILKAGDTVTFADTIQRTVSYTGGREGGDGGYIGWKDGLAVTYFHEPYWRIAEICIPDLPDLNDQGFGRVWRHGNGERAIGYRASTNEITIDASVLMARCRAVVRKLQDCGVGERE